MIITHRDLQGTDYHIVQIQPPQLFSFSEVLTDMCENPYSRLENYFKQGFEFIKFQDEIVTISDSHHQLYQVFGKYTNGFFATDKKGMVWLMPFKESEFLSPMRINRNIGKFKDCYCLLLSIFFLFNAKDIRPRQAKKIAKEFEQDILKVDKITLDSLFYQNYIYCIENQELPTHYHPIHYVKSGRHFFPYQD